MTNKIGANAMSSNPAMKPFEPLIGEWRTTGSHPYFPDTELHGRVSFAWIQGGAFVLMHSEIDHPKFPDGTAIFGSDDEAGTYYQLYFDERGISRKYNVAMTDTQITLWRDDAHFSQRFTMTVANDRLTCSGEMRRDGGAWEKDLSLIYKKS